MAGRHGRGSDRKAGRRPLPPGRARRDGQDQAGPHADAVVIAFRFGKEEGTVGSLILGLYDDDGELHVVGHTSSFRAKQKRELLELLEPYRTGERGSGEPSRWKSDEELVWEGLRPELVVEVAFDHITGNRIRHGAKLLRWRDDKEPRECLSPSCATDDRGARGGRWSPPLAPAAQAQARLPDPAGQPVRRGAGGARRGLRVRAAQPVALLVRPPDRRLAYRGRRGW